MENTNIDQTLNSLGTTLKDLISAANQSTLQEVTKFLEFRSKNGGTNSGKGIIWSGEGTTKQIVYQINPDRFFVSESIDLSKGKSLNINNVKILDETTLGASVTKSNLREVGRLKGLIVDGSVKINQYMTYNATIDRLGLGTETPNAALGVADQGVEVMIGTNEMMHGMIGTYATNDLDIVTGNIPRVTVKANGNIDLGNTTQNPIRVRVHGKLSVGVTNPDPNVDLHVAGAARINNKLHIAGTTFPSAGTFNVGDIVWNERPTVRGCIGWVCLKAGSPGIWHPFGEIKEQNK
jgi:hypothetical protein